MIAHDDKRVTFTFVEMAELLIGRARDFGIVLPNDYTFKCDEATQKISFTWEEETDHG